MTDNILQKMGQRRLLEDRNAIEYQKNIREIKGDGDGEDKKWLYLNKKCT